jgi:hypothetical protein
MADANRILGTADPLRNDGVVYLDPALVSGPATHVLIIGVAAYKDPLYANLLDTATQSARAVADWFLGNAPQGFSNPGCALGSLAVLLSETHDGAESICCGGRVPRADFANARQAVRSWLTRINSNTDNLAFIYVASHGESFTHRTAFLLEDYGTDPLDATAGMVEVEQFISALENARPVSQLLIFDCCRSPMGDALPWDDTPGNKLISLKRDPNDHGLPRKQWVICSTTLGEVATGQCGKPTLFNNALMDALHGVAGDVSVADWPVRPGLLIDKIDHILRLHRLPDEDKPQTPAGRMAGSFDITLPGESDAIPVYVSLEDPRQWPGATITLSWDLTSVITVTGEEDQSPFFVEKIPDASEIQVIAENCNGLVGKTKRRIRAPASFVEIPKCSQPGAVGMPPPRASTEPMGRLLIQVSGPVAADNAVSLEIQRRDKSEANPVRQIIDLGREMTVNREPGDYAVTIRTPDGAVHHRDIRVEPNQIVKTAFETQQSPHEWLGTAAMAGALPPTPDEPFLRSRPAKPQGLMGVRSLGAGGDHPIGPTSSLESVFRAEDLLPDHLGGPPDLSIERLESSPPERFSVCGYLGSDLQVRPTAAPPNLDLAIAYDDGRFLRMEIEDRIGSRFFQGGGSPLAFAEIILADRKEMAVLPTIGHNAASTNDGWRPHLVVDREAPQSRTASAVLVEDRQWAGLLGFLGARNMEVGVNLLDSGMEPATVDAIRAKVANPLAAAAGALIVVSAAKPETDQVWDPWLRNLANWFPTLPDGAIILARRLLTRARSSEELDEARRWFTEGFQRGVPCYSLSVDWLARGLESLPGEDAALLQMQATARHLANRVDSGLTFTVARVDE